MTEKNRRKVTIEVIKDVSTLGQTTNQDLLKEFEDYEPEKYDLLKNVEGKTVISDKKST